VVNANFVTLLLLVAATVVGTVAILEDLTVVAAMILAAVATVEGLTAVAAVATVEAVLMAVAAVAAVVMVAVAAFEASLPHSQNAYARFPLDNLATKH
jgi:hypothetical protein